MPNEFNSALVLGPRFAEALTYTAQVHRDHWRKGTDVPYLAHLFAVAAIVLEDGGSEDEAIAALLHDAVEDRGGEERRADIERIFGPTVAGLVMECSDTASEDKEPWVARKQKYVGAMPGKSRGALRISAADKIHNARALLRDYRAHGETLWWRFNPEARSAEAQLGYYGALVEAFHEAEVGQLAHELEEVVRDLRRLVQEHRGADWSPRPLLALDGSP